MTRRLVEVVDEQFEERRLERRWEIIGARTVARPMEERLAVT